MNVGIVTTWFERGAAYVSRQYFDLLVKEGQNVFIYARGGEKQAKGDLNWDFSNVTWAQKSYIPTAGAIDRGDFLRWIIKNSINIVIFNEQHWMPAIFWAREAKAIAVAYVDYYTEQTIPFYAIYDGLICNTKRHYSVFSWHPQCIYIPWGTDVNLFKPRSEISNRRRDCIFFHSAGMSPARKGTDLVIEAFARMKSYSSILIVHTQVKLDTELKTTSALINRLVSERRLIIIEEEVPAPGLYHLGDVYVYPSRLEGIGLTQVEALSCGLPLICPDNQPMNEFINQDTGVAVAVEKYWSRFDGYYWPMCQVAIDELAKSMDTYASDLNLIDKKNRARTYSEKHLNWLENGKPLIPWLKSLNVLNVDVDLSERVYKFYPPNSLWYWFRSKLKQIIVR